MSRVTPAEVDAFLVETFGRSPHHCEETGDGYAVVRMDTDTMVLRPGAIISGPTVFGLVDAAITYAGWTRLGVEPMLLTRELSIRYVRPAQGSVLRARAEVNSVGSRTVVGTAVVWTDSFDKPCAVAQGTFALART